MPSYPYALRVWNTGPNRCPPEVTEATPPGYGDGCVAVAIGGTHIDWADNVTGYLQMRMDELQERLGFSDEAAATLCVRMAGAGLLWVIFYDPKGLAPPAEPLPPPPQ